VHTETKIRRNDFVLEMTVFQSVQEFSAAQPHLREGGADVQPRLHRHGQVGPVSDNLGRVNEWMYRQVH